MTYEETYLARLLDVSRSSISSSSCCNEALELLCLVGTRDYWVHRGIKKLLGQYHHLMIDWLIIYLLMQN